TSLTPDAQFSTDLAYEANAHVQSTSYLTPSFSQSGSSVHPFGDILAGKHQDDPQISLSGVRWGEGLDWFQGDSQKYYACIVPLLEFPLALTRLLGGARDSLQSEINEKIQKLAKQICQQRQFTDCKHKVKQLLDSIANLNYQILELFTLDWDTNNVFIDTDLFDFLGKVISVGLFSTHGSSHQLETQEVQNSTKLGEEISRFLSLKNDEKVFEAFTLARKKKTLPIKSSDCLISKIAVGCLEGYYRRKNLKKFEFVFEDGNGFLQALLKKRLMRYFDLYSKFRTQLRASIFENTLIPWAADTVQYNAYKGDIRYLLNISTGFHQTKLSEFLEEVIPVENHKSN
ncbi:hypothetical protein O181_063499, partial [Austropuccinia psidii MF-1]|nr:hypothetical protein [Austropuccinia psidii MF-1]